VGESPESMVINERTNRIYVANTVSKTVSVIHGKTNKVVAELELDLPPYQLVISPRTQRLYVLGSDRNKGVVSVFNTQTNKLIAGIPTAPDASDLAIHRHK